VQQDPARVTVLLLARIHILGAVRVVVCSKRRCGPGRGELDGRDSAVALAASRELSTCAILIVHVEPLRDRLLGFA